MITIRELTPADAKEYRRVRLMALQVNPEAFLSVAEDFVKRPMTQIRLQLKGNVESPDVMVIGAFDDAKLVGMMGFLRAPQKKSRHKGDVIAVFVDPAVRGRGVGGQLLDALVTEAQAMDGVEQMNLGVMSMNTAAIALYESRGFVKWGHEPRSTKWQGEYHDEDWMVKFL